MTTSSSKSGKLHWLKFNPTEWLGMFPELSDQELGMLHRVIAKMWATPGNRMSEDALLTELRLKHDESRAAVLRGLVGYALRDAGDGTLFIPALDDAFADMLRRVEDAQRAAGARWQKTKLSSRATNPEDF